MNCATFRYGHCLSVLALTLQFITLHVQIYLDKFVTDKTSLVNNLVCLI